MIPEGIPRQPADMTMILMCIVAVMSEDDIGIDLTLQCLEG